MANVKNMRMEELESEQQEMQEKIAQMTKMVTNLTKGKGTIDNPSLQREPALWKGSIDPFIEPSSDDPCEQERLREDPLGRLKHVDMQ